MKRGFSVLLAAAAILLASAAAMAQASAQPTAAEKAVLGTWTGSWTGGSSGMVEFTFARGADGKIGGSATPHPSDGDPYEAAFTSVVVAAGKVSMTMMTPDGAAAITVTAAVEGSEMKGEYVVRAGDGTEVDRGSVTAKKKA